MIVSFHLKALIPLVETSRCLYQFRDLLAFQVS